MRVRLSVVVMLVAASAATGCGQSQDISQVKGEEETSSLPVTVLESSSRRLILMLRSPVLARREEVLNGERFERLTLDGYESNAAPGAPELPALHRLIALPSVQAPTVTVLERGPSFVFDLESLVAFKSRLEAHDGDAHLVVKDEASYHTPQGDAVVNLSAPSFMGRVPAAWLTFAPLRYDPSANALTQTTWVKVEIAFGAETAQEPATLAAQEARRAQSLVLNPEVVPPEAASIDQPPLDLIIAHASYRDALAPLIAFKRSQARDVLAIYLDQATTDQVMQLIRDAFSRVTPPSHVLLVGSIDQIPAHRTRGIWTDLNYSLIDSGTIPDVSVARIPAQSSTELAAYVAKAIARATAPRDVESFLLTAGRDRRLGCPANMDRIGQIARQNRASLRVSKLYRANGATQARILAGYNANPNVVVYDGHGDEGGMVEIPLQISHLPRLTNETFPIVLDIAGFNAHWLPSGASRRNFAEKILLQPDHGAAGIVAAGGNSGGHAFFQRIVTHMVRGRAAQLDGAPDPVIDEIGQIVLAAKIESSYDDNAMFTYLGDPALGVFR